MYFHIHLQFPGVLIIQTGDFRLHYRGEKKKRKKETIEKGCGDNIPKRNFTNIVHI